MKTEAQIREGIRQIERSMKLPLVTASQKAVGKASVEILKWVVA